MFTYYFRGLSMPAETRICSCCIYYMQKFTSSFESCQSGYRKIKHTRELISARKTSHKHNNKDPSREDLPMVEFMYLVFTCMQGESYRMRLRSLLLCSCDVFRALINSIVCWLCTSALGLVLFQIVTERLGKIVYIYTEKADQSYTQQQKSILVLWVSIVMFFRYW